MDKKIISLKNPALHLGQSVFRARLDAEDYVDMGLPSGTKWAASNLDIDTESKLADSPFQYKCSFFSWGNVEGHNPLTETTFEYDFGNVNEAAPWYEGQPYGDTPGSTLVEDFTKIIEFDAARSLLGDPWRTPKGSDFQELINNTIYIDADGNEVDTSISDKRVTVNDVKGIYLQSKINGNRLFFPASGYGYGSSWNYRGNYGRYWSSTFVSSRNAIRLSFLSGVVSPYNNGERCDGYPIRPVMN